MSVSYRVMKDVHEKTPRTKRAARVRRQHWLLPQTVTHIPRNMYIIIA